MLGRPVGGSVCSACGGVDRDDVRIVHVGNSLTPMSCTSTFHAGDRTAGFEPRAQSTIKEVAERRRIRRTAKRDAV